jgi:hypothetical protein
MIQEHAGGFSPGAERFIFRMVIAVSAIDGPEERIPSERKIKPKLDFIA